MAGHFDRRALVGRWLHAHEEDSETERVFRPASWALPPSRGRSGFELGADGSLRRFGPGPTDRPEQTAGTWRLVGGRLEFEDEGPGGGRRALEIVSLTPDRLVVRRGTL